MPTFKPGRLAAIWLNSVDVSGYFASADLSVKQDTAEVTTFGAAYKSYIAGVASAVFTATGYYDSADADKVRDTLQAAVGQVTFFPAGATAIGDPARLININSTDYRMGDKTSEAVAMDWAVLSTAPVGAGTCLHVLQSENLGTITGTGDGLLTSASSTTGAVAHLHVTAVSSAVASSFKLQDSTTQGGVYTDIASGAFTNVTAIGSQRLVVPGTIRQFVRVVAVIGPATTTYGVAVART